MAIDRPGLRRLPNTTSLSERLVHSPHRDSREAHKELGNRPNNQYSRLSRSTTIPERHISALDKVLPRANQHLHKPSRPAITRQHLKELTRIQLFHLANQADSRTSKSIQEATAKVAKQTRDDSASMITIAAMTLVFLPGTFISSIMSTTFFNYQGDGVQVSSKWWILLPTILPLTVVVVGIWLGWLYVSRREAYKRLSEKMGGRFKRRVSMKGVVKDRKCDA